MKTLLLIMLVCLTGCGGYYHRQPDYQRAFYDAYMMDQALRPPVQVITHDRRDSSTYWQERQAHDQYWDSQYRKLGVK